MAETTKIEWTEATWNPITGCSLASPGCTNCYAMLLAGTRLQQHWSREGLTRISGGRPKWTGEVRFNEQWLDQPLRWKRPRMIFVCAHGDLFHESVPDEWIDQVFAIMILAHQHTFQVLTKRAARMREYLSRHQWHRWSQIGRNMDRKRWERLPPIVGGDCTPLPNVWLGVSVEDQTRADERIPDLLATPAAKRWLSCEPLLGSVQLHSLPMPSGMDVCDCKEHRPTFDALQGSVYCQGCCEGAESFDTGIDWIVCGGESGPGARPIHPDWARSLRDQCADADVPFFFKQWGEWKQAIPRPSETPGKFAMMARDPSGWTHSNATKLDRYPRQFDCLGSIVLECVGKKAAGRLLDGVQHDGMPS